MTAEESAGRSFRVPYLRSLDLRRLTALVVRPPAAQPPAGWLVICAAIIPALLVGGWLIADAVQPSSYSPIRQTVSVTAGYGGTDRWIMTGALVAIGACYLVIAVGLTCLPAPGRIGLLLAGASAFGIAACPQPVVGATMQHAVCTAIGAVIIAFWPALMARPLAQRRILKTGISRVAAGVFVALLIWTIIETQGGTYLGIAERVSASIQACWPAVVAFAVWRRQERLAAAF
jgi:hypothetical protein